MVGVVWKLDAKIPLLVSPGGAYHLLCVRSVFGEYCAHHTPFGPDAPVCAGLLFYAYCTQYNHTLVCVGLYAYYAEHRNLLERWDNVLDTDSC